MLDKSTRERFDWFLFITLCLIVAVGVMFIWSAKSFGFAKRQLIWTGIAMAVFFSLLKINYLAIAQFAYVFYGIGVLGLLFV
ncbi:MAG: hypothetical protein FJ278_08350, partial [Planctomycetes bacterium]|nr:hypothetical protein [Planctomycetota bacterium]